jgi:hypothetical protein
MRENAEGPDVVQHVRRHIQTEFEHENKKTFIPSMSQKPRSSSPAATDAGPKTFAPAAFRENYVGSHAGEEPPRTVSASLSSLRAHVGAINVEIDRLSHLMGAAS